MYTRTVPPEEARSHWFSGHVTLRPVEPAPAAFWTEALTYPHHFVLVDQLKDKVLSGKLPTKTCEMSKAQGPGLATLRNVGSIRASKRAWSIKLPDRPSITLNLAKDEKKNDLVIRDLEAFVLSLQQSLNNP